ncbi:MAG: tryptophan--tRNA ligase [Myxococcales bacterium]|nr:tryptophan--tRNA ligase [Myxococcales bacterium]
MRILSGITSSGECHLGNYFGAIRQHISFQSQGDGIYFIADYHSMTSVRDARERRRLVHEVALDYLACGLDPEATVLYRQSDLPEVCELSWILTTVTPMGLLERSHAYKDKVAHGISADHGLFAYPVLMAADILIYNSDVVPIGQDQKQHLEMTRDIAQRFNRVYGVEVFQLPEPHILEDVAVVPGTDGRKMSKSYDNTIRMFWPEKQLKQAVMGIVTDSTPVEDPKDTRQALFQLWSLFADEDDKKQMFSRAQAGGLGYGDVKKDLLARLLDHFGEMRDKREALAQRPDEIEDILASGARRARELGAPVMAAARNAAGLGRG